MGGGGAGLGHSGIVLLLRNTGARTCSLRGYPGAALVTASGQEADAARTPSGYLGGLKAGSGVDPLVVVGPGRSASALLEGLDATSSGGACPTYSTLLVTPPNTTSTFRITRVLSLCRPEVHPVVPGVSGNQG